MKHNAPRKIICGPWADTSSGESSLTREERRFFTIMESTAILGRRGSVDPAPAFAIIERAFQRFMVNRSQVRRQAPA